MAENKLENSLKIAIGQSVNKCFEAVDITPENIMIEIPKDSTHGDYSTNIAMQLTRTLHKNPREIATAIVDSLDQEAAHVEKVEIAGPGFINFFMKNDALTSVIVEVLSEKDNYGQTHFGEGKKYNVEFVSANPTGDLHLGHAKGAAVGDSICRIMTKAGYDVTREYYINDAGNQMNNLGISIKERYKELCNLPFNIPEDGYHGKEIVAIAKTIYDSYKEEKLTENIEYFKQVGLNVLMQQIKKDLDNYRVNFDVFTSEQSLYDKGEVENVLNQLKKNNDCYIKEDALWLNTSKYGDEKDRVIVKNDGNYTYFLPDIAYHVNKIKRGYQELIDVLGADHHGYINRLKASLEILGYDSSILNVKILQMVRLLKDGEEVKISKRTGKTITLNDLIDEVGINATRYFFASKSLDTQMDFDLSLAVKNSNENPVYYIEYANARIASLLNNYKKEIATKEEYKTIEEPLAYTIMNKLLKFTDTIIVAAKKQQPHIICNYVYELTSLFHTYYSSTKFITDDEEYTNDRIALLSAIKIVINNSLNLIGIIPREQM